MAALEGVDVRTRCAALKARGIAGQELFDALAHYELSLKLAARRDQRCAACWHDARSRCICSLLSKVAPSRDVKAVVLMHHREYYSAGNTGKLLLAMLPAESASLFVYGRSGDWEPFVAELAACPRRTMVLWPGVGALTLDAFLATLGETRSEWASRDAEVSAAAAAAPLRVVVLDGTYNQASHMLKAMRKRLPAELMPPAVALHPTTVSVFHRARNGYGAASARETEKHGDDPKALRVCSVEAVALLLRELGERAETVDALVAAVVVNNEALSSSLAVRPAGGMPVSATSGAARRRRRKEQKEQAALTSCRKCGVDGHSHAACNSRALLMSGKLLTFGQINRIQQDAAFDFERQHGSIPEVANRWKTSWS